MSKRTFKEDKLAKLYDTEVVPIWSKRFGKMLLRELTIPNKAMVLDINCGSGYPSLDILKKMDEQGRIIAIDTSSPLLDEARAKAGKLSGKRIFFRSESTLPKLSFTDEVYDLVIANAGIHQLDDPEPAVRECARVCKSGGRFISTYPLAGTFGEFHDLFREVLIKGDYKDALDRLDAYLTRYPPLEQAVGWFEDAGFTDVETEYESFTLLFKSSREFFFAPIIEYGPLSNWKAIAGKGQQMQDVFWQTKAAIDAYFAGSAFSVTVNAGCIRGRKAPREPSVQVIATPESVAKGARASSNPKRVSGSGVRPPGDPDLPDAPSDDVEALSGSWPMPDPQSGSQSRSKLSDYLDFGERDEIPTGSHRRRDPDSIAEPLPESPFAEPPKVARHDDPADPGEPDENDEIDAEDHIESESVNEPSIHLSEEDFERESTGTGSLEIGSGEIELVPEDDSEGLEDETMNGKRKRVSRRDDPDDPDIL